MGSSVVVIQIPGPQVRSQQNEILKAELVQHLENGHSRIVLNFSGVDFVDSSFLGMIIVILKRATSVGGDVRICCLTPALTTIFSMMRLNRLFTLYPTLQEAEQSFDE
ncbi:MAG: STAS domain-containing protein [Candidatus Sumerlaeia bacterium]|nr:STAS domain-containing protein [Candidatus Sumerlaeia bacterium]